MIPPLATVLIPTFDHGATLRFAVDSALSQSVPVEVFIIGDGVPQASRDMIREIVAADHRVRFFDHPKHAGRGEPYRHAALCEAGGRIVCYLCDRDLWLPDHVARMATLLETADFAHSLAFHIDVEGRVCHFPVDLALPAHRRFMLTVRNRVPLSCAAHRLAAYHRLEDGWDTTPQGKETDWHLFQKFLANKDCICASATWPSALTFPSKLRRSWSEAQRVAELRRWQARIADENDRQELVLRLLESGLRARDRELALAYDSYLSSTPRPA